MRWFIAALKKYDTFTGRAQRKEFWYFVLFWWLTYLSLLLLNAFVIVPFVAPFFRLATLLPEIFMFGGLLPMAAVTMRRLHDSNRSGWWFAFVMIPIAGWFVLLLFTVPDGTPGQNSYGPDPKGRADLPGDVAKKDPSEKWIVPVAVCAFLVLFLGLPAAVFIPAYQDMESREKVRGGFNELNEFKPQFAAMVKRNDPSETLATAGISLAAGKVGLSGLYNDPKALVLVGKLAPPFAGKSLGLKYVDSGAGPAEWKCGSTNLERKLLPGQCRDEVSYVNAPVGR